MVESGLEWFEYGLGLGFDRIYEQLRVWNSG